MNFSTFLFFVITIIQPKLTAVSFNLLPQTEKRKKYRKEAYETLRNYKSKGWKIKKVVKLKKNKKSIDTRTFKIYLISK